MAGKATKRQHMDHVVLAEFKGSPIIGFHGPATNDDRYAFQFGPAKARKLLRAMEVHGEEKILNMLRELAATTETGD